MDERQLLGGGGGGGVRTSGRIEAIHVYDLVNIKVLVESRIALGVGGFAEVACSLDIEEHTI